MSGFVLESKLNVSQYGGVAMNQEHYSEEGFWGKLRSSALRAGRELVRMALCLYYVMIDPKTPLWAKTTIAGALGYFILPIDAVPDFLPVVGYSDDLGAMMAVWTSIQSFCGDKHRRRADEKLREWFGE
ncbi:MAG: YkvA family protein [Gemmataceae bacterium]|nr:YkvA family protein [Gemmataceae bacterium]MDW8264567.1 YkvA family protein [Gemmataceae bacterium]